MLRYSRRKLSIKKNLFVEVLTEAIAEEIITTLRNEYMACYDLAVQVIYCYLNNSRDKVGRNFYNAFQLVDL